MKYLGQRWVEKSELPDRSYSVSDIQYSIWFWGYQQKVKKDENGKNVPRLEITKVVYVPSNIVNRHYY